MHINLTFVIKYITQIINLNIYNEYRCNCDLLNMDKYI